MSKETEQALGRPPRLKQDASGYDWREFDRWLQTIQRLLGAFADGQKSINLFTGHLNNLTNLHVLDSPIGMISTDTPTQIDNGYLAGMIPNAPVLSSRKEEDMPGFLSGPGSQSTFKEETDILTLYWVGV